MIRKLISRLIPGPRAGRIENQRRPIMATLEPRTLFAVPAAPTSLSASIVSSNTQIQLKWTDRSSIESGFYIYRGTSSSSMSKVASVGSNTTYYKQTPPSKGTTYYYKVRAYNSSGTSSSTNTVSAKVPTSSTSTSTASFNKTIYISSSSGLNSADWPSSGESTRFVLDSHGGPYNLSFRYVTGNLTIESSNSSDPAVIKLPDVWDSNGIADNGTLTVKGSLTIRNIKTTGGED